MATPSEAKTSSSFCLGACIAYLTIDIILPKPPTHFATTFPGFGKLWGVGFEVGDL